MINSKLDNFLKATKGADSVSAVLYDGDSAQLESLQTALAHNGYHEVHDLKDLIERLNLDTRLALYTKNMHGQEISDLLSQLNIKKIEMFDNKSRKKFEVNNIKAAVIFILEKPQIKDLQLSGYKLLEDIGLTYQM
jgi:hypothetical protein